MSKKTGKDVPCTQCEKLVYRSKQELDRSKVFFCSQLCHGEYKKGKRCAEDLSGQEFGKWEVKSRTLDYIHKGVPRAMWEVKCSCGVTAQVRGDDLRSGKSTNCGCVTIERLKAQTGSRNPGWRGGVSSENNKARNSGEQRVWVLGVFKRDDFTCQKCGDDRGGNLNAHHILAFSKHTGERLVLSNGVTLCRDCHKEFHRTCGLTDFTKEDYEVWMNQS